MLFASMSPGMYQDTISSKLSIRYSSYMGRAHVGSYSSTGGQPKVFRAIRNVWFVFRTGRDVSYGDNFGGKRWHLIIKREKGIY